jgi:ribonuclease D
MFFYFYLAFCSLIRTFAPQMKKIIYNKFDKALIATLPRVLFEGRIVVVLTEREAAKAVDYLLSQPILGVDTETRPSFKKGRIHRVALLQVSSREVCFLFRLNQLGLSPSVKRLLEDTTVPKIGLSLRDDLSSLHKLGDFNAGNFIDLQDHVREIGVEDLSLQKLYANFFAQKISKREQLTNWEADILQDKQKLYAATDAWSCIQLYEELMRLEQTGDYELITVTNDDNVQADSAA